MHKVDQSKRLSHITLWNNHHNKPVMANDQPSTSGEPAPARLSMSGNKTSDKSIKEVRKKRKECMSLGERVPEKHIRGKMP